MAGEFFRVTCISHNLFLFREFLFRLSIYTSNAQCITENSELSAMIL